MEDFINSITTTIGPMLLRLLGALLVLLIGWIIARVIANIVRRLLGATNLDNRVAEWAGGDNVPNVEEGISKIVYYLLMVLVLIAFFQVLGLTIITEPLNALLNVVLSFVPQLLAAGILVIAAWIVATILRGLTRKLLETISLDKRLDEQGVPSIAKALSEAVYWLVWLLFLPPILGALGLQSLVTPLSNMFDQVLAYVPKVFAAAVILVIGWFVARIVQRVVTSFLAALGADGFAERVGLTRVMGKQTLSNLLGLVVFIIILIPVIVAALDALEFQSLTEPITGMLNGILGAIPSIIAAFAILVVATVVGRLIGDFVAQLLEGFGFDNILVTIGLTKEPVTAGRLTPSRLVGYLVLVAIILLAVTSATSLLNFPELTLIVTQVISFTWNIIIGLIIFGIGLWLANLIATAIENSSLQQKRLAALFARVAVVTLATAMALGQMGLAESIVNLAFGLILGAVAVAVALAFGLGGREIAGRELQGWVNTMHEEAALDAADSAETTADDAV